VSEYTDKLVAATREQLIGEVLRLRGRIAELERLVLEACEIADDRTCPDDNCRCARLSAIRQATSGEGK
jgi:hypothetical protein